LPFQQQHSPVKCKPPLQVVKFATSIAQCRSECSITECSCGIAVSSATVASREALAEKPAALPLQVRDCRFKCSRAAERPLRKRFGAPAALLAGASAALPVQQQQQQQWRRQHQHQQHG
jgi:hypothetical protein